MNVYWDSCEVCGDKWSERLTNEENEIRVGKEIYICKCEIPHNTGNREWTHLTKEQRYGYFRGFSFLEKAMFVTFVIIFPVLFGLLGEAGDGGPVERTALGFAIMGGAAACLVAISWG